MQQREKKLFFKIKTKTLYFVLKAPRDQDLGLEQGSQTHLGVRATPQDITQPVGRIVFRDDKMQ